MVDDELLDLAGQVARRRLGVHAGAGTSGRGRPRLPRAYDAGQVAPAVVHDDPDRLVGHDRGLARCTSGGAADHGKSIHASVCRQTYSGWITVHGFS